MVLAYISVATVFFCTTFPLLTILVQLFKMIYLIEHLNSNFGKLVLLKPLIGLEYVNVLDCPNFIITICCLENTLNLSGDAFIRIRVVSNLIFLQYAMVI